MALSFGCFSSNVELKIDKMKLSSMRDMTGKLGNIAEIRELKKHFSSTTILSHPSSTCYKINMSVY